MIEHTKEQDEVEHFSAEHFLELVDGRLNVFDAGLEKVV